MIAQFKGQIVIEDFGFYARPFHTGLVREDLLMAGVFTLSELDEKLRQMCLLMPKESNGCTYEDAKVLAAYSKLQPDPTRSDNPYNRFIEEAMAPKQGRR